ncbi:restriction endonuclease [Carnobacterium divergens]|uniref:restriction endonuclease n=1 Tax=Carnobacterium divergens TaxID=2748 RepID=UPI000D411F8D|nr:restriction endonuclease [Carnobacterium divergens]MCO6018984.1 restriction endonuclease [Carnobacterium divergens]TFI63708.1 restriction endonuclease [Carnobacterium divergens]TFI90871.1 restriction endonuclease [Carnobacterium divergens]TFJ05738.1 restriction endonuclease [Carnobacterium divergens]TFJ07386.1 restriction endonuclease [Carnobacterium divergens]
MNTDWQQLKQSANGIPQYDSLIPYILEVLKNGEEATSSVIKERVIRFLQIPESILAIKYPNDLNGNGILLNRYSFALSDLYKANAIDRPKRGIYKITEIGQSLLQQYGSELTKKNLEEQPAYQQYMQELAIRNERAGNLPTIDENEPKEINVESIINNQNNEVAIELLNKVQQVAPAFFEIIVVDLLVAMGYSGENGEAKVTTRTNDGGIDGIINQDPLGTSTVYIQAKRYKEENTIGRPAIQSFYGALAAVNADRGVFITTSSFSKGAQDFAKNQGIVLIDGIKLTELMLQYGVGIEIAKTYQLYRIDNDYFESEI